MDLLFKKASDSGCYDHDNNKEDSYLSDGAETNNAVQLMILKELQKVNSIVDMVEEQVREIRNQARGCAGIKLRQSKEKTAEEIIVKTKVKNLVLVVNHSQMLKCHPEPG